MIDGLAHIFCMTDLLDSNISSFAERRHGRQLIANCLFLSKERGSGTNSCGPNPAYERVVTQEYSGCLETDCPLSRSNYPPKATGRKMKLSAKWCGGVARHCSRERHPLLNHSSAYRDDVTRRTLCVNTSQDVVCSPKSFPHSYEFRGTASKIENFHENRVLNKNSSLTMKREQRTVHFQFNELHKHEISNEHTTQTAVTSSCTSGAHKIEHDVIEIRRMLRKYVIRLADKERQSVVAKEWRVFARVLDRLFFILYVSTIVLSLLTIFPKG